MCLSRLFPLLALVVAVPALGAERVLDRVVVAIDGRAVTLSELSFEARVTLVQHGGVEAATAPLDEAALANSLDWVISQRLLLIEADRLGAFALDEEEVERALAGFRARFKSDAALKKFLDDQERDLQALTTLIVRQLRASRILDSKIRLRAQVTDSDVQRYYEAHRDELGQPLDALRGALREKLVRERTFELAAQEAKEARRTADVRLIAPFARAAAEGKVP